MCFSASVGIQRNNDLNSVTPRRREVLRNWFALQFNQPNKVFTKGFFNFNTMQKWTTEGLPTTVG